MKVSHRQLRRLAALAALVLLPACRSYEPLLHTEDGEPLRKTSPALYRVAVTPVEIKTASGSEPSPALQRLRTSLQQDLVTAMREVGASTEVFPLDSAESFEAYTQKADLMLEPRVEDARFEYVGTSGRAAVSVLLWLTTWIGSLWVEDANYEARLVVRYDVVDPFTGARIESDLLTRSDSADLSFFERNQAFSGDFFLSMLVPPFLTRDNEDVTTSSLEKRATEIVAAQLKDYLKERLPDRERDVLASVDIRSPENGSTVVDPAPFLCEIVARGEVTEIQLLVNDAIYRKWNRIELPSAEEQRRGEYYLCPVRLEGLELPRRGRNDLRLLVNVSERWASRSLVLYHGTRTDGGA